MRGRASAGSGAGAGLSEALGAAERRLGDAFDAPDFPVLRPLGLWPGLIVSFAFGLLQLFLDVAYAAGWQSIIGDYLLAFAVMGFAGLFKGKKNGIYWGSLLGTFLRFLVHYVTGATLWAEYMPDEFFGMTMTSPWIYSALYNGSFLLLSLAMVLVVIAILQKPLGKYLRGDDLKK